MESKYVALPCKESRRLRLLVFPGFSMMAKATIENAFLRGLLLTTIFLNLSYNGIESLIAISDSKQENSIRYEFRLKMPAHALMSERGVEATVKEAEAFLNTKKVNASTVNVIESQEFEWNKGENAPDPVKIYRDICFNKHEPFKWFNERRRLKRILKKLESLPDKVPSTIYYKEPSKKI